MRMSAILLLLTQVAYASRGSIPKLQDAVVQDEASMRHCTITRKQNSVKWNDYEFICPESSPLIGSWNAKGDEMTLLLGADSCAKLSGEGVGASSSNEFGDISIRFAADGSSEMDMTVMYAETIANGMRIPIANVFDGKGILTYRQMMPKVEGDKLTLPISRDLTDLRRNAIFIDERTGDELRHAFIFEEKGHNDFEVSFSPKSFSNYCAVFALAMQRFLDHQWLPFVKKH